jgi:NAD(P)-dependent dehydrogenase (short-subunit alcohol dehydrogenase family)
MSNHPALAEGRAAVVTGAASGIGLAAARRFAAIGMRVCLADLSLQALQAAAEAFVRFLADR